MLLCNAADLMPDQRDLGHDPSIDVYHSRERLPCIRSCRMHAAGPNTHMLKALLSLPDMHPQERTKASLSDRKIKI